MLIAMTRPSTRQGDRLFADKARNAFFFNMFVTLHDRGDSLGSGFTERARAACWFIPLWVAIGSKGTKSTGSVYGWELTTAERIETLDQVGEGEPGGTESGPDGPTGRY
jgi:hypothetical protein